MANGASGLAGSCHHEDYSNLHDFGGVKDKAQILVAVPPFENL